MKYNTGDFNDLLDEITAETERIKSEMNIFKLDYAENVTTYNSLTTVLLKLKEID